VISVAWGIITHFFSKWKRARSTCVLPEVWMISSHFYRTRCHLQQAHRPRWCLGGDHHDEEIPERQYRNQLAATTAKRLQGLGGGGVDSVYCLECSRGLGEDALGVGEANARMTGMLVLQIFACSGFDASEWHIAHLSQSSWGN
jgi:hypothetical protein